MDMKSVQTFILAAEHENFRIVAERLFITQPAITFQIRQLEKELGDKLFIKQGRNVYLTEYGRVFYHEAKKLVDQYNKSKAALNRHKQGFLKTIRLGISPMLADTILPSVIHKYIDLHPNVEFSISVKESIDLIKAVESREVDLGLSCMPGYANITSIKFHEEPVSLICKHDGYDAESGPIIDAVHLLEENIIFTDNHPVYWDALKRQLNELIPNLRFMKVNQSHITKRFVLEGIGVSFLPKSIIHKELMEGRLLEIPINAFTPPKAAMYIIYKHEHVVDNELTDFITNVYYS